MGNQQSTKSVQKDDKKVQLDDNDSTSLDSTIDLSSNGSDYNADESVFTMISLNQKIEMVSKVVRSLVSCLLFLICVPKEDRAAAVARICGALSGTPAPPHAEEEVEMGIANSDIPRLDGNGNGSGSGGANALNDGCANPMGQAAHGGNGVVDGARRSPGARRSSHAAVLEGGQESEVGVQDPALLNSNASTTQAQRNQQEHHQVQDAASVDRHIMTNNSVPDPSRAGSDESLVYSDSSLEGTNVEMGNSNGGSVVVPVVSVQAHAPPHSQNRSLTSHFERQMGNADFFSSEGSDDPSPQTGSGSDNVDTQVIPHHE